MRREALLCGKPAPGQHVRPDPQAAGSKGPGRSPTQATPCTDASSAARRRLPSPAPPPAKTASLALCCPPSGVPQHVVAEAARRLQARARGGLARQRANSVRARLFALVTLAAVRLQARVRGRLARRRADAMRRVRDFARRPAR